MQRATQDPTDVLGGLALFADLTRPQLEAITHIFEEVRFSPGDRILREGFTGNGFYVILEGEAVFSRDDVEGGRLAKGDFFGEVSALLGEPPISDVVAASDLRCLLLGGPQLQEFLEEHPKVMYRMLQAEAARLRNATL